MHFIPPRCPYRDCDQHTSPTERFYVRHGSFRTNCRPRPIPRFRCRTCRRSFSSQTFRHDYFDKKPQCNRRLVQLMVSGVGLRQSARMLGLSHQSVQRKLDKLAKTGRLLHENLCRELPPDRTYVMDEEETYERASIRPLTMPLIIDKATWFVVTTDVGSIRRLAATGTARRKRQDRDECVHGRRRDESAKCVTTVLRTLARKTRGRVQLHTDEKASYRSIGRRVFGDRLVHHTTAGSEPRTTYNPLFPINTTIAMTRDNCGRLRRKSWLVTKKASRLLAHMAIFTVYRNYVRRRFNYDPEGVTPGRLLGLVPRGLSISEAFRWRQDWGMNSSHPTDFPWERGATRRVA